MNFRVVDYAVSRRGYLMRVCFTRPTKLSYKFHYLSAGAYSSIVIIDFLMATRVPMNDLFTSIALGISPLKGAFIDELILVQREGIKQGQEVESAIDAARDSETDGLPDTETVEAARESSRASALAAAFSSGGVEARESVMGGGSLVAEDVDAEGTVMTLSASACRVHNNWKLNVVRDVAVSQRVLEQDTSTIKGNELAVRIHEGRLYIDRERNQAERNDTTGGAVPGKMGQGHRLFRFNGTSNKEHSEAVRPVAHDLDVMLGTYRGDRIIANDLVVLYGSRGARYIDHIAGKLTDRQVAERIKQAEAAAARLNTGGARVIADHPTTLMRERHRGTRLQGNRRTDLLRLAASIRDRWQRTYVGRTDALAAHRINNGKQLYTKHLELQGKLKIRQYPLVVERIVDSVRFSRPGAAKARGFSGIKTASHPLYIPREKQEADRYDIRDLFVTDDEYRGMIKRTIPVVLSHAEESKRNIKKVDTLLAKGSAGWRLDEKSNLYLLHDRTEASREFTRGNLSVNGDPILEGGGTKDSDSAILDDTAIDNASKAPYPFMLVDEVVGERIADPKLAAEIGEQLAAYLNRTVYGSVSEETAAAERLVKMYESDILLEALLASAFRHMEGSILDVIYGWRGMASDLMEDTIFADLFRDRSSAIDELFDQAFRDFLPSVMTEAYIDGVRDRIGGLMELELLVSARNTAHSAMNMEVGAAEKDANPAISHEVLLAEDELRPSALEIRNPFGYLLPDPAFIDESIEGVTKRERTADVTGGDIVAVEPPKPSYLGSGIVADEEAKPSIFGEGILAQEPSRPANLEAGILAIEPERPADLAGEIVATEPERPADLGGGILATEPERPSRLEEDIQAQESGRPSSMGGEILATEPERPSHYAEAMEGLKPFRPSDMGEGDAGWQEARPSRVGEEQLAHQGARPSDMGESYDMDRIAKDADLGEGAAAVKEADGADFPNDTVVGFRGPRPANAPGEEYTSAELQKRVATLMTGYVLAGHSKQRVGYLEDVYYTATAAIDSGLLPAEDFGKYASLVLDKAFLGEGMFATNPDKAAALLMDILARTEPTNSVVGESILAHAAITPAFLAIELTAEKQRDMAELVSTYLQGSKKKASAVISEAIMGQEIMKRGHFEEGHAAYMERLKQALIESADNAASGLLYNYTNKVLPASDDVANWTGGFGVPEDYDPHDPLNPYYSWVNDLDESEMGQGDWQRFGMGAWHRDKERREFYADDDNPGAAGYFYNDFTHSEYTFKTDFKVDDTDDDVVGIVFKYVDAHNHYRFAIHGGNAEANQNMVKPMQLFKITGGVESKVGSPMTPFPWVPNAWNTAEVHVIGGRIKIWVNGRLQYDFMG